MPELTMLQLRSDFENAKIIDYRDPNNPNNEVVITCEHAKNDLPDEYTWTDSDRRHFVNEHWGLDIGAYDMANHLASELKCVFVHSLYSRLLIDPNRSIVADTLFRKDGDGWEVDLNKGMTYEEEQKRINKYFISYYEALREISLKVNPTYVLSIHSFTPLYEGEKRSLEIGILYGLDSIEFAHGINDGMKGLGYASAANEPYDGLTTMGTVKSLIFAQHPTQRKGLTFEFRNDLLSDPRICPQLKSDALQIIRKNCKLETSD